MTMEEYTKYFSPYVLHMGSWKSISPSTTHTTTSPTTTCPTTSPTQSLSDVPIISFRNDVFDGQAVLLVHSAQQSFKEIKFTFELQVRIQLFYT